MENFIDHITIQNFKSIRELKLEGLERINLFIGKPNVGKSNILEAFGVFSLPYLKYSSKKNLSNLMRVDFSSELFFDGNTEKSIIINCKKGEFSLGYAKNPDQEVTNDGKFSSLLHLNTSKLRLNFKINSIAEKIEIDDFLNLKFSKGNHSNSHINYYLFKSPSGAKKLNSNNLLPPNGVNLMGTIENNPFLKNEIKELFYEYGLTLVFDRSSQELKVMKDHVNDEVFLIPYSSIADTLQRIIFFKTAIASNQNSVLIFEEPEAHAFPPYIVHITHEIVESKSNQFILSTHSPYILDYFLENAIDELAIFMVDYKNGETVVNKLTKEDLTDIWQYGIDLFTNYETFLK